MKTRNRWIMYAQIDMAGNQSFRVTAHKSLEWCKTSLEKFARTMGMDVSATLYPFDDESWKLARDFQDVGCPFDYASRKIERGPRGAFHIENC